MEILALRSAKSSRFIFFLILLSYGIYLFKVWLKRSYDKYAFSFSIQKTKLFFKDKHSYYNLSIKGANYQLDSSKLIMHWQWLFLRQNSSINHHTEKQNENKKVNIWKVLLKTYLKIEEYLTIYDWKLFEMNYYSEYSGILPKIVFVTCEMKTYPWNFSFWTCTKLRSLFDLGKSICH